MNNIETSNIKQTEFTDGVGAVVIAQDEGVVEGDIPILGSIFDHKFEEVGLGWQTVVPSNEDGAKCTNSMAMNLMRTPVRKLTLLTIETSSLHS